MDSGQVDLTGPRVISSYTTNNSTSKQTPIHLLIYYSLWSLYVTCVHHQITVLPDSIYLIFDGHKVQEMYAPEGP